MRFATPRSHGTPVARVKLVRRTLGKRVTA